MGGRGDALFVPDDLGEVGDQVRDSAPPSEQEMRQEHPHVHDCGYPSNQRQRPADAPLEHRIPRPLAPGRARWGNAAALGIAPIAPPLIFTRRRGRRRSRFGQRRPFPNQHPDQEAHHDQESHRRHVELGAQAQPERNRQPQQRPAPLRTVRRLDEPEQQQIGPGSEGDVDDVEDGNPGVDDEHPVAQHKEPGQRADQARIEHSPPQQIGNRHQRRAQRGVGQPPGPGVIAEQDDRKRNQELGQRRMGIKEVLAVQIMPGLTDEMDFVKDDLVGMPDLVKAQERRRRE